MPLNNLAEVHRVKILFYRISSWRHTDNPPDNEPCSREDTTKLMAPQSWLFSSNSKWSSSVYVMHHHLTVGFSAAALAKLHLLCLSNIEALLIWHYRSCLSCSLCQPLWDFASLLVCVWHFKGVCIYHCGYGLFSFLCRSFLKPWPQASVVWWPSRMSSFRAISAVRPNLPL